MTYRRAIHSFWVLGARLRSSLVAKLAGLLFQGYLFLFRGYLFPFPGYPLLFRGYALLFPGYSRLSSEENIFSLEEKPFSSEQIGASGDISFPYLRYLAVYVLLRKTDKAHPILVIDQNNISMV